MSVLAARVSQVTSWAARALVWPIRPSSAVICARRVEKASSWARVNPATSAVPWWTWVQVTPRVSVSRARRAAW